MAVTNENSVQLAALVTKGAPMLDAVDSYAKLRHLAIDFTQGAAAGDANSTVGLIKLPPGKVKVIADLSRLATSAFGASRVLNVGNDAYVTPTGETVALDADSIHSGADVSAAGVISGFGDEVGADGTITFNSRSGVTIRAQVTGGTIPAAATINGFLTIAVE